MPTDIEIAQSATLKPIAEVASVVGLSPDDIEPYGKYKAKIPLRVARGLEREDGRLVLVTGISPTPAGEGKSTISVGLTDALALRGRNPVLCLREPSLGPVFGMKGGAAGGGYSQVVPMEDINLHFTGDIHAISSAHALLSAMMDNHLFRPNSAGIDTHKVVWRRAVDMNDRALRNVVVGLGGRFGGIPREDGYMITTASEIMAIFCLASGIEDLTRRLGSIVVGYDSSEEPIRARDFKAEGAMTLLLKDALAPNLVQTLGGAPALIHGGPFANIAHGCNSLLATKTALKLGDVVVTEAGFGADLGAEKFFDIKCRFGKLDPGAAVIVCTARAMKMHGGVARSALAEENVAAVQAGIPNLARHIENVLRFGVPPIVAINRFAADTDAEIEALSEACRELGTPYAVADPWGGGGAGCTDLADAVWDVLEAGEASYRPLYESSLPIVEKIRTIAKEIYRAEDADFSPQALRQIERIEAIGMADAPVCMAKTQYSFSDDPTALGAPEGFHIFVREVTPSAGAGFVVAQTGDVMVMPGLPAAPGAEGMSVSEDGTIRGLA